MDEQMQRAPGLFVSDEERAWLLSYCAGITKQRESAEDLVQETLLEAWRHQQALRDVQRRGAWFAGIARNICLRWLRSRERDARHVFRSAPAEDDASGTFEDGLADDFDIELVLERKELVELLDRALALLPEETRTVLIQRYVEESPLAEIAGQLGTNTGAVAMRLQRGKLALRRVLTQEMKHEAALYLPSTSTEAWETTPLWCHVCGRQRLLGQHDPVEGKLLLFCPHCDEVVNRNVLPVLKGVRGYRRLYSRLAAWCDHYYHAGLRNGAIACIHCGRTVPATITAPRQFPRWMLEQGDAHAWMRTSDERIVMIACEYCQSASTTALESLMLEAPAGQRFLQAHPRIRTLPRQYLEVDGRAAILTRFESVLDTARLEVVADNTTLEVLRVAGDTI
jgi:RNA polymerase sigma factor (sigma-70 family)